MENVLVKRDRAEGTRQTPTPAGGQRARVSCPASLVGRNFHRKPCRKEW